ncbi:MAG: tetratricopeptide repeat protein [Acidobacteria bacterium]|nr:tetratricopeptide repeat protein [Acidobacteriota bacterium]
MKLLLFLSSSFLTLLLIVHSVKSRGVRTSLYFFVSAFLFGVVRGNSVAYLSSDETGLPYVFSEALILVGKAELPACVGWVFALYLSWTLAEGVLRSRPRLGKAVFPLSSFAIIAMGCFSDAVETTASGVGWWRWNIINRATPLLPAGTHLFGIVEWMSAGLDYLVPFLLFRTSRGARSPLAWTSLLLWPLHWATHWKFVTAPGLPHAYEIYHALIVFAVPAFVLLKSPALAPDSPRGMSRGVALIPMVALAAMFAVLLFMDLGVLKDPELLISLFPLAVFAAGDRGREKLMLVAGMLASGLAFGISVANGRELLVSLLRAVPPILPPVFLILTGNLETGGARAVLRRAYVVAVALGIVAGGVTLVRGKRMREEYSRLMYQAQGLMEAGNFTRAESVLKQAVALNPGVNLGTKYLANAYGAQGNLEEAWKYALESIELNPTDFEAHKLAGKVLVGQGRVEQAVPYYERALMLNPGDSEAARSLAECDSRLGRYADAIAALGKALARNPDDTELAHLQGALLIQTGNFREALRVVQPLLEKAPNDSGAHLLMAYIRAAGGDTAAARAEAQRALQLNPSDPQAKSLLESLPK